MFDRVLLVCRVALPLCILGYVSTTAFAQSTSSVTLGNTIVTGRSQNFGGISVDFFGGESTSPFSGTSCVAEVPFHLCVPSGIPFAEPPVGTLRFAPPVPLASINASTLDATQFGPACAQLTVTIAGFAVAPLADS